MVEVPGVSMELCGGTHVSSTSEIRGFRIITEQGIASGIRRIEAVAGDAFIEYVNARDNHMRHLCSTLKVSFFFSSLSSMNGASIVYTAQNMGFMNSKESYYYFPIAIFVKVKAEEVTTRVETLLDELRVVRNEVSAAHAKAAVYKASMIASNAFPVGSSKKIR